MASGMTARILIAVCCLLWSCCSGAAWAADADILRIERAEVVISDALTEPPDDAGWQSVALPHRSAKPAERDLVGYWYQIGRAHV